MHRKTINMVNGKCYVMSKMINITDEANRRKWSWVKGVKVLGWRRVRKVIF